MVLLSATYKHCRDNHQSTAKTKPKAKQENEDTRLPTKLTVREETNGIGNYRSELVKRNLPPSEGDDEDGDGHHTQAPKRVLNLEEKLAYRFTKETLTMEKTA